MLLRELQQDLRGGGVGRGTLLHVERLIRGGDLRGVPSEKKAWVGEWVGR